MSIVRDGPWAHHCQFNKKFNAPTEKEREQCSARLVVHYLPVSANLFSVRFQFTSLSRHSIIAPVLSLVLHLYLPHRCPSFVTTEKSFSFFWGLQSKMLSMPSTDHRLGRISTIFSSHLSLVFTAVVPLCASSRT